MGIESPFALKKKKERNPQYVAGKKQKGSVILILPLNEY